MIGAKKSIKLLFVAYLRGFF